jgi:D-sedoheptulose 7-phosphate isomerase
MVVGSWLRRQIQLSEHSSTIDVLEGHLAEVKHVLGQIPIGSVERIVDVILDAHRSRRRVYILGNGGSASTAGHFAADLSKATIVEGQPRLRVQSLADNQALITAWANDSSFDRVFAEQLENLIDPQDVVVAISVSGNSPNVLSAMRTARSRGAVTVGLVGASGGSLADVVDTAVRVPSDSYGVVEDCHLVLEHAITESTRRALLEPSRTAPVSLAHHPALFLDRDGVINRRRPEHVKSWAEFEFLPGALDALAEVKRAGIKVIVITNQAAVGRGLLREQELTERWPGREVISSGSTPVRTHPRSDASAASRAPRSSRVQAWSWAYPCADPSWWVTARATWRRLKAPAVTPSLLVSGGPPACLRKCR